MNGATVHRMELMMQGIVAALKGIKAAAAPDKWLTTVVRVERGLISIDEAPNGISLFVNAGGEAPWTGRSAEGVLAGGSSGQGIQERVATVQVHAWIKLERLSDAQSIALAADIERAVLEDNARGGHAHKTRWTRTDRDAVMNNGVPIGSLRLDFSVFYRTDYGRPGHSVVEG